MKHSTMLLVAGAALAGMLASSPAFAVRAFSTVHLHIRSGPGEQFPVVGEMRWNSHGEVDACTPDYVWCHISTANGIGWAAGHYLTEDTRRGVETLQEYGAQLGIPVVAAEVVAVGMVTAVAPGGALIEAIAPAPEVLAYVAAQPVAPVHVTGEIVVGAVLPPELVFYPVPGSPHHYAVVNGVTVLVEPATRQVVYIAR